jgi:hypothetical protein
MSLIEILLILQSVTFVCVCVLEAINEAALSVKPRTYNFSHWFSNYLMCSKTWLIQNSRDQKKVL